MLEFSPENHEYRFDGKIVPSVTQVIRGAGMMNTRHYTEWVREKGSAVHLALQYLDEGTLNMDTVDERIMGYIEAYKKFKRERQDYSCVHIEKPRYNETYRFAGTPDRECLFANRTTGLDFKTGTPEKWHGIQIGGGYFHLMDGHVPCVGLYLTSHGTYKLEPYNDRRYRRLFMSGLDVFNHRKTAGLLPEEGR